MNSYNSSANEQRKPPISSHIGTQNKKKKEKWVAKFMPYTKAMP